MGVVGCESAKKFVDKATTKTPKSAPPKDQLKESDKFKEYILPTELSSAEAYAKAKSWVASAFKGVAKFSLDDPQQSHFILKAFLGDCQGLGGIRHYEVSFLIDFQARE